MTHVVPLECEVVTSDLVEAGHQDEPSALSVLISFQPIEYWMHPHPLPEEEELTVHSWAFIEEPHL